MADKGSVSNERTLEDISNKLIEAKLNADDMYPATQCLYYSPNFSTNQNYKLLEVDKHLLERISNGELQFRGDDDDNVVLTSNNQTYEVVQAETSDSLLLVTDLLFKDDLIENSIKTINTVSVNTITYEYLETRISRPRFNKLNKLLERTAYKGPELEYQINQKDLVSFDDLLATIQSSPIELKKVLGSLLTTELHGYIRLIDFEYHFRVLSYMLKLIDEYSWHLDEIDYDSTIISLSDIVPEFVINAVFNYHTEESKIIDSVQLYRYKEESICKFFATVLLSNAGKFNLNEFLQAWSESVPEGMVTTEEMLYGLAIINKEVNPNIIQYYSDANLPEDVFERFKVLFDAKKTWTVQEIAPYIEPLATEQLSVNGLLAKYARVSHENGIKYYSSKYSK